MLTAHLPSGYVLAKGLGLRRALYPAALLGAVFPDFDMIWFHLVDHRAVHHHRYWVHAPGFWVIVASIVLPLLWRFRKDWLAPALIFLLAVLLHLVLDSIVGGIMWLWPYSTLLFQAFEVQPTHSHWVLSFTLHWSFGLELVVWLTAGVLFLRARGQSRAAHLGEKGINSPLPSDEKPL